MSNKPMRIMLMMILIFSSTLFISGCVKENSGSLSASQTVVDDIGKDDVSSTNNDELSINAEKQTDTKEENGSNQAIIKEPLIKPLDKSAYDEYYAQEGVIYVDSEEELLDAIASDVVIEIAQGTYNLSKVANERYGSTEGESLGVYYADCFDGVQIVLADINNLTIRAARNEKVELVIEPRYADVLKFIDCNNITLENMTMGHTGERGSCEGDVLEFEACNNIGLHKMDLYGCGTFGVAAYGCSNIEMTDSIIRECSYGIVDISNSSAVEFTNCYAYACDGYYLLNISRSDVTFTECTFRDNISTWGFMPEDYQGNNLIFKVCEFGQFETQSLKEAYEESSFYDCMYYDPGFGDDVKIVEVGNEKAILEAIDSNTSIKILQAKYNFTDYLNSVDITQFNEEHEKVRIVEVYDGRSIEIHDVKNLSISSAMGDYSKVTFLVEPRYADVFTFFDCSNISIDGITMGHTDTGDCIGNVLSFRSCRDITLTNMDLFGCGVYAVWADNTDTLKVKDSILRDCSFGPYHIASCRGDIQFINCEMTGSKGVGYLWDNEKKILFNNCFFGGRESEVSFRLDDVGDVSFEKCRFSPIEYYEQ